MDEKNSEIVVKKVERPDGGGLADMLATLAAELDLPRVPQQERSRAKRDSVLEAGAALFAAQGYDATAAEEIAKAAGVSIGTFYSYFRNKRQLFFAIMLGHMEQATGQLQLLASDFFSGEPRQAIRQVIAPLLGDARRMALRRIWLDLLERDPELQPLARLIRARLLAELRRNLARAADQGYTWPGLDVDATAAALTAILQNLNLSVVDSAGDERLIDSLTDLLYRGIIRQTPVEQPLEVQRVEHEEQGVDEGKRKRKDAKSAKPQKKHRKKGD